MLYEAAGLPAERLPPSLGQLYGGELGFPDRIVYANFVASLDGVTAVDPAAPGQGGLISGGLEADRFLMGLLRAFADVVLVGAGTLRAEADHVWSPGRVYPPAVREFSTLRETLGRPDSLPLAVVTAGGSIDPRLPALAGGLILTTPAGAARIGPPPDDVRVIALGVGGRIGMTEVLAALSGEGFGRVLTEGGPHLFGQLLEAGLVDELFLTVAPVLAGRERSSTQIGLVEGVGLLPDVQRRGGLLSVRRSGDHLFLRYRLS